MRRAIFVAALVCLLALSQTMASAASVHLKGGKNAAPTFTDAGLYLTADGELSGLGNGDVQIDLVAQADVVSTCTNNGGNAAPGQNPAPITVAGSNAIPDDQVKNGTTPFSVASIAPDPLIPGAPDCPNANWTESIDDLLFTSATIIVYQPAGNLVLTVTCTFSPPTSDGLVAKQHVSCSQS